jgi:hypothetical protein
MDLFILQTLRNVKEKFQKNSQDVCVEAVVISRLRVSNFLEIFCLFQGLRAEEYSMFHFVTRYSSEMLFISFLKSSTLVYFNRIQKE